MHKANKRYGIMGGTFDPIHLGHLFIAETALDELNLDKVVFIPTGHPPHKDHENITDAHHRLQMTSIAIHSNKTFKLSAIEVNRKGPSYTIDTVRRLLEHDGGDVELYFITGTDAFMEVETWKRYKDVLQMIKIVVATRLGYSDVHFNEKVDLFTKKYKARIIKVAVPILEISSSDIRNRIKEGKTIKYLVPEGVEEYIRKNQLYQY
ncbi:nicotinate-nucleotide adenylyltransferase [Clostridium formicaceticum]|uniref:Probable nicotinate-nucleotide adenylyltransferase n=1 Tax=Clostridium formicaceticum TaxID=1497 RepID=A0AAC9RHY5_9CLOT|nr:nicotinate-nucleotide adenylyltransferase [Clostridium formicaceticum]AOY76869.1 nicotinate (nicotinamide) nucleotide adenylyltransferase [Clostridium formicaceticum]ARE87349.1 Nicotinate-nucleotide adenylyltransferase [Clostridium formicaceticum]